MTEYEFVLTGRTSLLMHADDVEASDELKRWRCDTKNKDKSIRGDDRSPPWTWQTYWYSDGERLVLPSENFAVALRQAGAQVILKRQKTFKELTQSGMGASDEFIDFTISGKHVPIAPFVEARDSTFEEQSDMARDAGFRLFVKRARVGQMKHVRVRPRFDVWEGRGRMRVFSDELTQPRLEEIFEIVGRVGMGDWRPGCRTPGPYGQFTAKIKKA